MENPPQANPIESQENPFLDKDAVLALSPGNLSKYLDELEEKGKLLEYLEEALKDDSIVASLSYWEKWFTPGQQKIIDEIVEERFSREGADWELPLGLEKKFNEEELISILFNISNFQPSFGCSRACPLCALDAVKGVRSQIPARQIENLIKKYYWIFNRTRPNAYFASEPKDYRDPESGLDYPGLTSLFQEHAGYTPHVTTANFSGEEWKAFLNSHPNARLSLWGIKNPDKITANIKTRHITGKEKTQQKGLGVSRRELGYKPEENGISVGISHLCTGVILTPRGLYNIAPVLPSDDYPQGIIVSPLERIKESIVEDIPKKIGPTLNNCVIQVNAHLDEDVTSYVNNLVRLRQKGEFKHPPYWVLLNDKKGRLIVFYDLDGKIDYIGGLNEENLNHVIYEESASDRFAIKHEGLTQEEMFSIKIFLLAAREPEIVNPKKVEDNNVYWEFEMPEMGTITVSLIRGAIDSWPMRTLTFAKKL